MSIDFVLVPASDERPGSAALASSFFFDPAQARRHLAAASASGFDAVIVDDAAGSLANFDLVANIARWNRSLEIAMTHWAGVTAPTVAAGDIAALDRLAGGRLSLRIIVEGGAEPVDAGSHLAAWQRTDEYLTLLKRLWSNSRPIDHEGTYYRLRHALVADKGPRGRGLPIRMSGRSGTAVDVSARHATVFELPDASFAENLALIDRVEAAALRYGRAGRIRFSAPVRAGRSRFDASAATLSRYVSAGVTEFCVSGLPDAAALGRFEAEVVRPLASAREHGGTARALHAPRAPARLS